MCVFFHSSVNVDTTDSTLPTNLFKVLSKDQMESDVKSGAYVEWGKVNGHYYGIRFSELRKIIANGRTAVLDCQPQVNLCIFFCVLSSNRNFHFIISEFSCR